MQQWMEWQWDALMRFVMSVLLVVGASSIGGAVVIKAMGEQGDVKFVSLVVHSIVFHGGVIAIVAMLLQEHQATWRTSFGMRWEEWRSLLIPVIVVLGLCLVNAQIVGRLSGWLIQTVTGKEPEIQQAVQWLQENQSPFRVAFFGLVTVCFAPVVEELIFRGILFTALTQYRGRHFGIWCSSILFGVIHVNLLSLLPLVVMGFLLTFLYERTRNLWAPITAHAVFNLVNFVYILNAAETLP